MIKLLHITSDDIAGEMHVKSEITGEISGWHDGLNARSLFLEQMTTGGLTKNHIFGTLTSQY